MIGRIRTCQLAKLVGVFLTLAFLAAGPARSSCGDYVHTTTKNSIQDKSGAKASHAPTLDNVADFGSPKPCRGPGCSRDERSPVSTPPATSVRLVTPLDAILLAKAADDSDAGMLLPAIAVAIHSTSARSIEHPPRD